MHKLIEYICDELDDIEKKSEKGKLSMAEIEYADKLAHLKKNLLRADELMEQGYSGENRYPYASMGNSYAGRGRGSNAQRDSRGRYSSERGGRGYSSRGENYSGEGGYSQNRGYSRYVRDDYSMDTKEVAYDLRTLMNQAPDERMRQELQRIITKVEQMDD